MRQGEVTIVCVSGIAGSVYSRDVHTSTAHAFYGLHIADLPWNLVVERAVANKMVMEHEKSVDTVIWNV